jgi:hypothetical protein
LSGEPWRPKNQASQGDKVEINGTPRASANSSAAPAMFSPSSVNTRSHFSPRISSLATTLVWLGSD